MKINLSTKEKVLNYIKSPLVPDGPWSHYGYVSDYEDNEDLADLSIDGYLPDDPVILRIPDKFLKDSDVIFELAKKSHYTYVPEWADKSILDDEEKLVQIYGKSMYIVGYANHDYLNNKEFLMKALDYGTAFAYYVNKKIIKDIDYAEKITSLLGINNVKCNYNYDNYNKALHLPKVRQNLIDESLFSHPRIKRANLAFLCKIPISSFPDDDILIRKLLANNTNLIEMHYDDITEYDDDINLICKTLQDNNDYISKIPENLLDNPKIYNACIDTIISHRDGTCMGYHCTDIMDIPKKLRRNKSFMKQVIGHIRFNYGTLDNEAVKMIDELKDFIFVYRQPMNTKRFPDSYLEQKDWLMFAIDHEPATINALSYNSELRGDADVFHKLYSKDENLALEYVGYYLKENDDPAIAKLAILRKGPYYVPSKYFTKELLIDAALLKRDFSDVFKRNDISEELRKDKDIARAIVKNCEWDLWSLIDMDLSVFDDKEIYDSVKEKNEFVIAKYEELKANLENQTA